MDFLYWVVGFVIFIESIQFILNYGNEISISIRKKDLKIIEEKSDFSLKQKKIIWWAVVLFGIFFLIFSFFYSEVPRFIVLLIILAIYTYPYESKFNETYNYYLLIPIEGKDKSVYFYPSLISSFNENALLKITIKNRRFLKDTQVTKIKEEIMDVSIKK